MIQLWCNSDLICLFLHLLLCLNSLISLNLLCKELPVHSVDDVEKEVPVNGLAVDVLHVWEVYHDLSSIPYLL